MSCTLPWRLKNSSVKVCSTNSEYLTYNYITMNLKMLSELGVFETTGCMSSCSRKEYSAKLEYDEYEYSQNGTV